MSSETPVRDSASPLAGSRGYFQRQAARYEMASPVQREVAEALAERHLPDGDNSPASILEIGTGSGRLTRVLRRRFPQASIEAIDISPAMVAMASQDASLCDVVWRVEDMDVLDLGRRYDLIASNCTLHWSASLADLLRRISRHLAPGGRLAASLMARGTLAELHEARRVAAPGKPAAKQLPRESDVLRMLEDSGLKLIANDSLSYTRSYDSISEFAAELRASCFTGGPFAHSGTLLGPGELKRLWRLYRQRYTDEQSRVIANFRAMAFSAALADRP